MTNLGKNEKIGRQMKKVSTHLVLFILNKKVHHNKLVDTGRHLKGIFIFFYKILITRGNIKMGIKCLLVSTN